MPPSFGTTQFRPRAKISRRNAGVRTLIAVVNLTTQVSHEDIELTDEVSCPASWSQVSHPCFNFIADNG